MAQEVPLSLKRKRDAELSHQGKHSKQQRLLDSRKSLPIWRRQDDIRSALRDRHVLILSGETGSGKSTQVPQFLLDQPYLHGKIAVTQPRRVAAISLARRVADEMGTPCGSSSPASKVGYSVRFDESTSPSTRIKFVTEGMLLQEMLRDGSMAQYGCIIVDEVHERSVNVDMILGFLKRLLDNRKRRKHPLKVVVMSATADVESISHFFSEPLSKVSQAEGDDTSDVPLDSSEEIWNGFSDNEDDEFVTSVSTIQVEGRQYPVKLHYLPKPTDDVINSALERIYQIHVKEPLPGDILVFLTGQETIQNLQKMVEEYTERLPRNVPKLLVLPLFAALPQAAQQRIFEPAPPNTRKVILSTNIAETSVTVPGARFVVDTGKAKIRHFRRKLGLDSLLALPISKSSADQRKGRAGREAPGQCYRLYTEEGYRSLEKDNKPEILRCDLSSAILNMKARGIDDIFNFPLLNPPALEAMKTALMKLWQLRALEQTGQISKIGRDLARLPLSPELGRVLTEAAKPETNCLAEAIDIVACLSVENIFLPTDTEESREQAQAARQRLFRRQGDHMTMLAAVQAYADEASDRKRWADNHLISHRAMRNVMDVRKQLRAQCKAMFDTNLSEPTNTSSSDIVTENVMKAFLRGFLANIARLCPDGSYKTFIGNQTVGIHPSSVLFGKKVEAIMYNEFVYTNKAYARGVSAVQVSWVDEIVKYYDIDYEVNT